MHRRAMPLEHRSIAARLHVPEPNRRIKASAGHRPPIRAPRHAKHQAPMSLKCLETAEAFHVPQFDGPIPTRAGELCAIGSKRQPRTTLVCPTRTATQVVGCVACNSHSRMSPSKLPLASRCPLGLHATEKTGAECGKVSRSVPVFASQSRTVASFPLLLASVRPSRVKARLRMLLVCLTVQSEVPRSSSHNVIVPSALPLTSRKSSGLKARADTVSVCACQTRYRVRPASRHTRTSPRRLPVAQYCPPLLVATAQAASKASVKTVSRNVAPASVVSCISTPCKYAPRKASCDRSRPRRCPRSSRSSASRFAGP